MFKFVFLLLIVPLTELYILIEIGANIGGLSVILLIILTAILGISFMRQQGMATMQKIQQGMAVGLAPDKEVLEGVFIFIGGLFLLLPGFITDTIGLLFLIPPTRLFFVGLLVKNKSFSSAQGNVYDAEWSAKKDNIQEIKNSDFTINNNDVIDGELIESEKQKNVKKQ